MTLRFAPLALCLAVLAAPSFADPLGLPLAAGSYIRQGEACATANDANLALVHEKGVNTPELYCEFEFAEEIDLEVWSFAGECEHVEQRAPYLNEGTIEIIDDNTFRFNDGVVEGRYSYCAPETLPAPYGSSAG
ncbi:hypothetical protein Q9295_08290 [Xinfangfangia sp. CPCC 101601]|uniref:DUF4453 domain-containing protein n=1 Tax=Pseudogemmobacter lacusdianii TaxID=3069608 RepID=A0ABU0VX83_9RHOB|nr:hypothetical protein [Xinfangfangia sp. CPCC 101601]MDQ2066369.1 hypothetical protein [Xinfangfangia sp. CPCC 101601]